MTWRATCFLSDKNNQNSKENFGFKTSKEPKRLPEMREFEDSILHLVENVEFKDSKINKGKFQRMLKEDRKKVKEAEFVYVKADKTNNYYKMDKVTYQNYCDQNVQKIYKKATESENG